MSKPSADFISKLNTRSFNSAFVKQIFPHIRGILNSLWLVTFILERMPKQTQHCGRGLGVWLSPDIQNSGVYS